MELYDIFVDRSETFATGRFNHCSTLTRHQGGVALAWYAGPHECSDQQSVFLAYWNGRCSNQPIRIGDYTGNPVLWSSGDECRLLWSRFEPSPAILSLADRWKHCSLWLQRCTFSKRKNMMVLLGRPVMVAEPSQHLLGRCRPVVFAGRTYLPLYDELERCGIIVESAGDQFRPVATIGRNMIQPTIWAADGKLCSLFRNFGVRRLFSCYSESLDGQTWTDPSTTSIKNNNSSLCVAEWVGRPYLIWNDTTSRQRCNLSIAYQHGLQAKNSYLLSTYGAYPSAEQHHKSLLVTYTDSRARITMIQLGHTKYKQKDNYATLQHQGILNSAAEVL